MNLILRWCVSGIITSGIFTFRSAEGCELFCHTNKALLVRHQACCRCSRQDGGDTDELQETTNGGQVSLPEGGGKRKCRYLLLGGQKDGRLYAPYTEAASIYKKTPRWIALPSTRAQVARSDSGGVCPWYREPMRRHRGIYSCWELSFHPKILLSYIYHLPYYADKGGCCGLTSLAARSPACTAPSM